MDSIVATIDRVFTGSSFAGVKLIDDGGVDASRQDRRVPTQHAPRTTVRPANRAQQFTQSVSIICDADFALESASLLRGEMLAIVVSRSREISMHPAQTVLHLHSFTRQAA